ncbi:MAG: hypothetical protein ACR2FH_06430, partial [Caulobacteraceae bacterium]
MPDDSKNLITFVVNPPSLRSAPHVRAEMLAAGAAAKAPAQTTLSRAAALARSSRVIVDTPALSGFIDLTGAR